MKYISDPAYLQLYAIDNNVRSCSLAPARQPSTSGVGAQRSNCARAPTERGLIELRTLTGGTRRAREKDRTIFLCQSAAKREANCNVSGAVGAQKLDPNWTPEPSVHGPQ
jgi:hypothetical protein